MSISATAITGAKVREEMRAKSVSQQTLAEVIGVSQSQFSRRLRGVIPFDINELTAIAKHFGVPLTTLTPDEVGVPS